MRIVKFIFLAILLLTQVNFSEVRYVSKTGSSTPPYTSWETASDSIQKCINISNFGDTIYVGKGVYEEQVIMIRGLSLIGTGMDSCVIDTHDLVTSQNFVSVKVADSCQISGFHIVIYNNWDKGVGISVNGSSFNSLITLNRITNGYEGIYLGNDPLIYKNTIARVSSGIDLFNSNAIVRKNIIHTDPNSQQAVIAGIYIEAFELGYYPIIDSNYIEIPSIGGTGIRKSFGARPIIRNNIIKLKHGQRGIFIGYTDSAQIYNNLIIGEPGIDGIIDGFMQGIYNNAAVKLSGAGYQISGKVVNNLAINSGRGIEKYGDPEIKYNNSWHNTTNYSGFSPDSTNLSINPMVVNEDTLNGGPDVHLQKFSSLIDNGDPNIIDKDSSRSDIGLYGGPYGESYEYIDLPPRPPVNLSATMDTNYIFIKWNKNTEADFNHYNLYQDTMFSFTIDSATFVSTVADSFYFYIRPEGIENLYFKLTAVDNQGNASTESEELHIVLTGIKTNEQFTIDGYKLFQNYPNPFNPSTKIGYRLKERGYVKLYVYDIKGELIETLVNRFQERGYYEAEFNPDISSQRPEVRNRLSSGVYIYQILVRDERNIPVFSDIEKMIYIK